MQLELYELLMFLSKRFFQLLIVQLLAMNAIIANSSAQTLEEVKLSIQIESGSLKTILDEIESQTHFRFSYERRLLSLQEKYSLDYQSTDLRSLLTDLSNTLKVNFKRIDNSIFVSQPEINTIPFKPHVEELTVSDVSGIVLDAETSEPLIGVTVLVDGYNIGTITDIEGYFNLSIPEDATHLKFSFVGYKDKRIGISSQSEMRILLSPDITNLEEIIVVGYTSSKTKDLTGSISVVDVEKVSSLPVNGLEQAIQGRVSGVQVTSDGSPGGGVSVRIRGYGTIGNNDPLYVIDGVPTKTGMNQFSMNDIKNIQVLKDAAATAIYGSRAANGVVIITTKSGGEEGAKISLNIQSSIQQPINLPKMLNSQEYADLLWEAERNSGKSPSNDLFGTGSEPIIPNFLDAENTIPASLPGTDWFDELFDPSFIQSYNIGIQSNNAWLKNYVSASYMNQGGIMKYTGFKKYNLRLNTELLKGPLKFGENLSISLTDTRSVPNNQALGSRMTHAYRINPIIPVKDINGNWAGPVSGIEGALNPIGMNYLDRNDRNNKTRIFGNIYGEFEVLEGLSIRSNLGVDFINTDIKNYDPKYKMGINERGETSFLLSNIRQTQVMVNNTILYKRNVGNNFFSVLVGNEAIRYNLNDFGGASSVFVTDEIDYIQLSNGSGASSNFSNGTEWSLLSWFAKFDYTAADKYLFSASIRRDGSSRFSENNRYAVFPAFSLGWRVSNEHFTDDLNWLEDFKLRFSWGQSGNQEIGDFTSFSTYSSSAWDTYYDINGTNTSSEIGFKPTRIGNPDVKWETTTQTNVGFDLYTTFGVSLTTDYFIKTTTDILLQRPTLAIEGQAEAPFVNLGEIKNQGLELSLGYAGKAGKDFEFSVSGNISFIKNEVTKLADDVLYLTGIVNNTYSRDLTLSRTQVGHPLAQFYGHVVEGIFKSQEEVVNHADQDGKGLGRLKFKDNNNDGVINDEDRTIIGNPQPDFVYGLNISSNFRGFDLSMFFQGVQGADIYNFTKYYTDFYYDLGNRHQRVLGAWSTSNQRSNIPMVAAVDVNNELRPSTYFIEDGSFLRFKTLQVGYTFKNIERIDNLRVYFQGQNLMTLTSYSGIDPEVGLVNSDNSKRNLDIGVDRGVYPNPRIFSLGLSMEF